MKPFCELIVSAVLPGIRALITKDLMQQGFSQQEISKKLGITQPAISQYKRELRGSRVKLLQSNKEVMNLIRSLSKDITRGEVKPKNIHLKMCEICLKVRRQKIICKLHGKSYPALESCRICFWLFFLFGNEINETEHWSDKNLQHFQKRIYQNW